MKSIIKILCILLLFATTATLTAAPIQDDQRIVNVRSWWDGVVEQVSWVLTTLSSCTGGECPAGGGEDSPEQGNAPDCSRDCEQSGDQQAPGGGDSQEPAN